MIDDFHGPYRWLSNFHLVPVEYEGRRYPSTENAYQAAKTLDESERIPFETDTPREARRRGRRVTLRPDWDAMRVPVMCELLRQKFTQPDLREMLLATGEQTLVEGNTWHDNFWGVCRCPRCGDDGANELGQALMKLRGDLRRADTGTDYAE